MANSLKDLVSSVDWGKMVSRGDVRNALVGSALGGLMLGGAGLLQKRDPEESRLAPVGDALTGALLGGVAGYAVPKGLALFRDAGHLAPAGDTLRTSYTAYGLGGAAAGAGVFGGSLYRTLAQAKKELRARAAENLPGLVRDTAAAEEAAYASGRMSEAVRLANQRLMYSTDAAGAADAERMLAALRRRKWAAYLRHDTPAYLQAKDELAELVGLRNAGLKGYRGFNELANYVADEARAINPGEAGKVGKTKGLVRSLFGRLLSNSPAKDIHRYKPETLFWVGPTVGPRARMALRGGKYALGGAALGMLMHKLFGPSTVSNYKN